MTNLEMIELKTVVRRAMEEQMEMYQEVWLTADDVLNNVKRYARNGCIITFHDSLKSIEKLRIALPAAIEWLLAEGYAFKIFE